MYRIALWLLVLLPVSAVASAASTTPAAFKDVCHCIGCHGEYRWNAKTDEEAPPSEVADKLSPSQIGSWAGPGGIYTKDTPRRGKERQWFTVIGRVSLVKIEADGDLHIQLVDENADDDDLNLVVEVPFGEPWCAIRETVFSWTHHNFPFTTSGKKFTLEKKLVIAVTGKAFYDAIHGGGDTSLNRRPVPTNAAATTRHVAIWEIHPLMKLSVIRE
jgi:hypothetical protein